MVTDELLSVGRIQREREALDAHVGTGDTDGGGSVRPFLFPYIYGNLLDVVPFFFPGGDLVCLSKSVPVFFRNFI